MTKKSIFQKNKQEIVYNIINSLLAGVLVFLGSLTTGRITIIGVGTALVASLIVAATKFKEYWVTQEGEYKKSLFNLA